MPHNQSTAVALLKWVNTFPLESQVETLADLVDGYVLSKMLEDIDPKYAVHDLEKNSSPTKWLSDKKSLEAVYKSLLRYIRNFCGDLDPVALGDPVDFNAIAEHHDEEQIVKLLSVFLVAAVKGQNIHKYIERIMLQLDPSTQGEMKVLIEKIPMEENTTGAPTSNDTTTSPVSQDVALALEEKHSSLLAETNELKKRHADFITRFEYLKESHEKLKDYNKELETEIRDLRRSNDGSQAEYIKKLTDRIHEQDVLIEGQENQLEADRVARERQTRELTQLRPAAQRLIESEDKVKELQTENLALTRKANKADHYLKKLEMQANLKTENETLQRRLDVLENNQQAFDVIQAENERIRTTLQEYGVRFKGYEEEVLHQQETKKRLVEELRKRDAQVEAFVARQAHDEDFVTGLQQELAALRNGPQSPDSPTSKGGITNLDEELERSENADRSSHHALEISRLKAENQLLKSNTAGTTNATLRIDLDEAERVRKRLEENLLDLTERHAIGQEQLNAIISNSSGEKNEAVIHTRKLYLEASQELATIKSKLAECQAELSARDRDLLAAKADLAAIDEEEMAALENLKATNEIITSSLQADLLILQKKHKDMTTDFEQQRSQLVEAFLSKDRAIQDLNNLKERTGTSDETRIGEAEARSIIESEKEKSLREQISKQESIIQDLQRRLKIAEETSPDAQKAKNEAIIKNLTRENAFISSAWYDLTSRLQSNHVVLQRRQDAPKSWLSKQRQMVNNATPRR